VPGQNLNAPLTAILINCSSPLLTQTFASLVDDPNNPVPRTIVQLNPNNNCTQGTTTLQALVGGRLNYFGQQGETNAGKLWSNAIDMTASYVFDMGSAGTFTPTFDGTYITKWFFGDFNLFGIPVARGFDGVGYRNTSAGRLGAAGQGAIPQYRLTLSLLYQKDKHTFNAQMRYVPSIIDDVVAGVPSLAINSSTPSSLTNANIGPVTGGAGCATVPTAANPTLISNLGSVPAGAGTAEYGSYCSAQNVTVLSGYKIASYFNLDLIYRFAVTDNISINAVIDNALNKDPSFARDQLGYDAGFGSPLGRTYQLGATIKF